MSATSTPPREEEVLVVSRELFDRLGAFHGFQPDADRYLPHLLDPENNRFLRRSLAEEDPGHKQLIPYAVFRHRDRFLHYVRGRSGGEKRLASKGSIGIGGHVNREDFHATGGSLGAELYLAGVDREIREEVKIGTPCRQRIIGLINDDSTEVGRVHLGVVHLFDLDAPDVAANEEGITELAFLSLPELAGRAASLETWSSLLVPHLGNLPA
jgi:predicted NUDIX family phosphoesterase